MRLLALILFPCIALAQIPFRPDFPYGTALPGSTVSGGRASYATNWVVDTILADRSAIWAGTLNDPYPGYRRCNMRYFIEVATGARNAIVGVSGYDIAPYNDNITFQGDADGDSITIWGQTAPDRYVVRNNGWTLNHTADNVIIEHITFMIGDSVQSLNGFGARRAFNNEAHCLQIQVAASATSDLVGVVLSHITGMGGIDSNVDVFNSNPDVRMIDDILAWRCLFGAAVDIPTNAEAVAYGYPDDGGNPNDGYSDETKDNHSYNFSIGLSYTESDAVDPDKANKNVTLLENVLASTDARNPLSNSNLNKLNNVIYNPDNRGTYLRNEGPCNDPDYIGDCLEEDYPSPTFSNILGNYYKAGPLTGGGIGMVPIFFGESLVSNDTLVEDSRVNLFGNIDDWAQARQFQDDVGSRTPHISGAMLNSISGITLIGAEHLVEYLVPRVGADSRYRTSVENKLLNDVTDGTNTISTTSNTLMKSWTNTNMPNAGGFPSITYQKRTFTDLPASPNGDDDEDGYSNLEEWVYYNHTLKAEFDEKTVLHGWNAERYPWMTETLAHIEGMGI